MKFHFFSSFLLGVWGTQSCALHGVLLHGLVALVEVVAPHAKNESVQTNTKAFIGQLPVHVVGICRLLKKTFLFGGHESKRNFVCCIDEIGGLRTILRHSQAFSFSFIRLCSWVLHDWCQLSGRSTLVVVVKFLIKNIFFYRCCLCLSLLFTKSFSFFEIGLSSFTSFPSLTSSFVEELAALQHSSLISVRFQLHPGHGCRACTEVFRRNIIHWRRCCLLLTGRFFNSLWRLLKTFNRNAHIVILLLTSWHICYCAFGECRW